MDHPGRVQGGPDSRAAGARAPGRRIDLRLLAERPDDVALLKDIWTDPGARDPRARAAAVTRDIAAKLAELAASLEGRGHPQEEVARSFRARPSALLTDVPVADLPEGMEDLWRAMDAGRRFGGRKLARFNGQFFHNARAIRWRRLPAGRPPPRDPDPMGELTATGDGRYSLAGPSVVN